MFDILFLMLYDPCNMLHEKDLHYLERLSKITLLKGKEPEYIARLSAILSYVGALVKVKTEDIEPAFQVIPVSTDLREDIVEPGLTQKEALMNAKHTYKGYFKVPPVID